MSKHQRAGYYCGQEANRFPALYLSIVQMNNLRVQVDFDFRSSMGAKCCESQCAHTERDNHF